MRKVFALVIVLLFGFSQLTLFAQKKVELINSGQILKAGIKFHDDEKYDDAIRQYEQIGRNDTNYALARYEEALSAYNLGHYDTVFRICRELMDMDSYVGSEAYTLYGSALDDRDKSNEAIDFYKKAIVRFPKSYLLHFNLGVAYFRAKKYDDAYARFKRALEINPHHPTSHYFLGILLADCQRWTPAMLAFHTALMLDPNKNVENKALTFLINIAKGEYTPQKEGVKLTEPEDPAFIKIDKLIESKIAFRPEYKIAANIDDKLMKQTQLILETLKQSKPTSNNYFVKQYVPLYSELMATQSLKTFEYYPYKDVDNELVTKWKSKSKKDIQEFDNWIVSYFTKISADFVDTVNGKPEQFKRYVYNSGTIEALGTDYDAKTQTRKGYWRLFYTNSNMEREGNYDNAGKMQGEWKSYYANGNLKTVATYKDGKVQGVVKDYFMNGNVQRNAPFKDDKYEGRVLKYYNNGALESENDYKAGVIDGKVKTYYQNQNLNLNIDAKNDKIEGKITQYNQHGYIQTTSDAHNGEKDGQYIAYFPNGKIRDKGMVKAGKSDGKWQYYDEEGHLIKECEFSKGDVIGVLKEYFSNGKLSSQETFDNKGKLNGLQTDYDEDGVKYFEGTFKEDKLVNYKYFDKTGKVTHEASEAHGELKFQVFTPEGYLWKEGVLKKGDINGTFTNFYRNGNVHITEEYVNGVLNGGYKEYYKSGVLHKEGTNKNGSWDGNFRIYFENGKLEEEMYLVKGDKEGDAYTYFLDGSVSEHKYFHSGDETGWQTSYYPDGKVEYEYFQDDALITKYFVFDTAGKVVSKFENPKGTADFDVKFFNGKPKSTAHYDFGHLQGPYKYYYGNGQVSNDAVYDHGYKTGAAKEYHLNGKIMKEGVFKYGQADSIWTFYDRNGVKDCKGAYKDGDKTGYWTWYYPNGKPEFIAKYKEGEKDSIVVMYAPDGAVRVKLRYNNGQLLSYTYIGKDGKEVSDIRLDKESGTVLAYYANGQKSYEAVYKNGSRQGECTYYYPDGKLQWEEHYDNGNKVGKQTLYAADGKLDREETRYFDEFDGPVRYYDTAGNLVLEENYKLGYLHGPVKEYDKGTVKNVTNYYYGIKL